MWVPPQHSLGMGDEGAIYAFQRVARSWAELSKLTASDPEGGAHFGESLSFAGDVAITGASRNNGNATDSGAAYVLRLTAGSWAEEQKLVDSAGSIADFFGEDVAIHGDIAVVGSPFDDPFGSQSGRPACSGIALATAGRWSSS